MSRTEPELMMTRMRMAQGEHDKSPQSHIGLNRLKIIF